MCRQTPAAIQCALWATNSALEWEPDGQGHQGAARSPSAPSSSRPLPNSPAYEDGGSRACHELGEKRDGASGTRRPRQPRIRGDQSTAILFSGRSVGRAIGAQIAAEFSEPGPRVAGYARSQGPSLPPRPRRPPRGP